MAAKLSGAIGAIVHSGIPGHELKGAISEVIWKDRKLDRAEPKSFLLLQDERNSGSTSVSTEPSQKGPFLSSAFANTANEGNLLPYVTGEWDETVGTPQTTPDDVELQVVVPGSLYTQSEWAWRYKSDADDQWRGMSDLRWLRQTHCPFGDSAVMGSCYAIGYSKKFNKVIVGYHPNTGNDLQYCTRSAANADPTSWGSPQTITFSSLKDPSLTYGYSCMWELPDGSMRWAYSYEVSGSLLDMDILGSTDGGETWTLIKKKVITELFGEEQQLVRFKIVSSGDWMRLEMYNLSVSPAGIVSATSSDRGATWQMVSGATVGDGTDETAGNSDSVGRYETWDVTSVDESGTFLRVRPVTSSTKLVYELASRDGTFTAIQNASGGSFVAPKANVVSVMCARGGGRVWVLVFQSDHHSGSPAGADYWTAASFIIPEPLISAGWTNISPRIDRWAKWGSADWLSYEGTARVHPKGAVLSWIGDRLAFLSGGVDRQSGTTTSQWQTPCLRYWGGTDRRPLRIPEATNTDLLAPMMSGTWEAGLGGVGTAPMTSSFSPWTETKTGSPTLTWNPSYMRAVNTSAQLVNWSRTHSLSGATFTIADAGCLAWTTRADGVADTSYPPTLSTVVLKNPCWGVFVASESLLTAGQTMQLAVHIDGPGERFALYDASAAQTLYEAPAGSLAGITTGTYYDFRLGTAHSSNLERLGFVINVEIAWAKVGDQAWNSSGVLTNVGGVVLSSGNEEVSFGNHRVTTSGISVDWKEFQYRRGETLGQAGFTNPSTMRGWSCQPHTVTVGQGHDITWGGAGGFQADKFTAPVRYEYGFEQAFFPSPSTYWQSTSTVTQTATLDSTLIDSKDKERFVHSGASLVNTNSRYLYLEYADDSAFTYPSRVYIDGERYKSQLTGTASPSHIKLTGDWEDGELAGHYLRAEPGSGGVANPGIAKIESNAGSWVKLSGVTSTLALYGLASGATVSIWGSQHLHAFDDWPEGLRVTTSSGTVDGAFPRYMRVTIPGSAHQGEPPEGAWKIGKLQAGLTLPFNVPLDWSATDSEAGNVDLQTMNSGARVAYIAGPPRLTFNGTSIGDADNWRVAFRSMIKSFAKYSAHPVVLCTDDLKQSLNSLYSRFTSSTEFRNQAWKYDDDNSRWIKVGDLAVTFEEEV